MSSTRFFRFMWRFNAIAIAAVAVIGGLLGVFALVALAYDLLRPHHVGNVVKATAPQGAVPEPAEEVTSTFRRIAGTDMYWAPIKREQRTRASYCRKVAHGVIDQLVFDPSRGQAHFLLGHRPALLIGAAPLRPRDSDGKAGRAEAILVHFVAKDSNSDNRLSQRDKQRIGLADSAGRDLKILPLTVRKMHGHPVLEAGRAVVFATTEAGLEAITVDLGSRSILKRVVLPSKPGSQAPAR